MNLQQSKLFKILHALEDSERIAFADFLASPLHNNSQTIQQLYSYYIGAQWGNSAEGYTADAAAAFATLHPHTAFDGATLQKLNSRLCKQLEAFIAFWQYKTQQTAAAFALLQFYNNRNLNGLFEHELRRIQAQQTAAPYRDSAFFFDEYRLAVEISDFQSYKQDDYTGDVHFQAANNALDTYYICTKLKQLCLMLNRARTTLYEYDYTLLDYFLKTLSQSITTQNNTIQLWYGGLLLLHTPTKAAHKQLKTLLKNHARLLPKSEQRHLYTYLENTARSIYAHDRPRYLQTLFDLYEAQLASKIIYTDENTLHPQLFYNIFMVGTTLGHTDWVRAFLHENKGSIIEEYERIDTVYPLCAAILAFEENVFEASLDLLNTTHFDNIYFKIIERRLRLKLYYEQQEWSLLESLLNSFRKFLTANRTKIPESQLQPQRDFVTVLVAFYKRAFLSTQSANYNELNASIQKIVEEQPLLPERQWIRAHLDRA